MKKFSSTRISTKELRKQIVKTAKEFGVCFVSFNNNGKAVAGTYGASKKSLYLCTKQTKKQLLQTFFHELGHHTAVSKNKWTKYHFGKEKLAPQQQFEIENKIEKIAQKLWNQYVDTKQWGMYKYTYLKSNKPQLINWLIKHNK